ncbi:HNH endonuclease signature motif containing protein [Sulfitobacter sp. 20_GPM-1509m]|uniref:HNH endonuclease signature motif containing protein n=1 Tax=Sulfitobacter sp. 20_GPM-1509m TaxID=1380367 RepID=UPI00048DC8C9|nr:HNH endonuclease signature motif containing protein [Sulfitobacter sp. 20_GPM-1509m]
MKGVRIRYTEAELAFIKAHHQMARRDLHARFAAWSGRTDVSVEHIKRLCARKGWRNGNTGLFEGQTPPFNENRVKNYFQKGQRPRNCRPVGYERVNRKGYVILIIDAPNPRTGAPTRPVRKHCWLWEQANGPIPKGHVLKCLDGDKTNCDPANWALVPKACMPRLSGGPHGKSYDRFEPEVRPTLLAIARLEHGAREARKGRSL